MENEKNSLSVLVYVTIAAVVALCLAFAFNIGNIANSRPPVFSKINMLQALWYEYKANYLESGTLRALDKQRDNITTSEGQSYSMLRAVWMDDKATFDAVWQWTKDNMQRREDHLVSWLFGERADGSYGVLSAEGGANSASDADTDTALALLFAWKRWNSESYFGDAIGIVRDIWEKEVVPIGGKPYLAANNVEKTAGKSDILVNPSYFAPYAYKIFAQVDPDRDWLGVASTSYDVLAESSRLPLDKAATSFLPPDWITIDRSSGAISPPPASDGLTTDFSFDAIRVPWRIALDYAWTGDPRAKAALGRLVFLSDEWKKNGAIYSSYSHDGEPLSDSVSPATYGGVIGYFAALGGEEGEAVYRKLESLYDPNESRWLTPQSYYDENWAWFGMALQAGALQDLFLVKPKASNGTL
ncbi:MAG TPA: glycosyl hydrolase family 8 [Candidatus Paceibacterota bacterium]|nr:glycosyl hydrolase family 8 [Candidatus Paceibacterota bacterium]